MKKNSLLLLALLCPLFAFAQAFSPERTAGVYYAYPKIISQKVHIPDGFSVFYISHYGRHGSRWLPDEARYEWVKARFADDSNLTPMGKSVKKRLKRVFKNAKGNAGALTKLGAKQHREIAERMATHYPEVFQGDAKLQARSSTVPRCRASMLAFCGALQKAFPSLTIHPETEARFMDYINYESAELKALSKRSGRQPNIAPDRFVAALFKNPALVDQPLKLLSELHTIAGDMQDIPLNVNLWDCFTPEEMLAVHDANNERMTIINGNTPLNDGIPARSSIALWQNIETEADAIIAGGGHGASLRFGHDTALFRLLTLLQLSLPGEGMEDIVPMAANVQLLFARSADGEVLVTLLHNEQQQLLPIPSHDGWYHWEEVKDYMHERLHRLEHQRQAAAINTMVGTAPANTRTAGLFGKGSEEHGQTLPAVLVPNGQTFWTPQTRDTEKKCVAPYYYTDSLLQGFRASHWLVGGCTQDYGSFTIATLSGTLRLTPGERATRFDHRYEISHPYYYAVYLPDEQLFTEMTARSHAALLRVTPMHDGPVHIVIHTNSDELEGAISVDTLNREVYAYNPVHRIYQGWGQRAGFSGHLVMKYTDEIEHFSQDGQILSLTFNGRKGHPIVLRAATSFTGKEGALKNLEAEANQSFESMARQTLDDWITRLHTIDVEDSDTARVNQFYGALYRASFLPREMSDVDGSYPRYASNNQIVNSTSSNSKCFGDFSMWDTYRALHPLYNIIVPETSGQMMQSLVTMYDEGGWLPIFPCWNSYTAAMIGDHCTSVLADAYVKGIRGFDAEKAYEGMRQNAMKSPESFEAYKNGMGRRALKSYVQYGYIPMEDPVNEAYHTNEQTSRTLEYAYDDFCVAQMAKALGKTADYELLMQRSENWRNVINPHLGYADGRHADGSWEMNTDLIHRKSFITEGATCHYTWYVPQNVKGLIEVLGGRERFVAKLDSMFSEGRYWHGNEPCHQVPWLYSMAGEREKTAQQVRHILDTEYNDTPGGLSGNDDAGQMSAWQLFGMMGFYPVCPATTQYQLSAPLFRRITLNQPGGRQFVIECKDSSSGRVMLNGRPVTDATIDHQDIVKGGALVFEK